MSFTKKRLTNKRNTLNLNISILSSDNVDYFECPICFLKHEEIQDLVEHQEENNHFNGNIMPFCSMHEEFLDISEIDKSLNSTKFNESTMARSFCNKSTDESGGSESDGEFTSDNASSFAHSNSTFHSNYKNLESTKLSDKSIQKRKKLFRKLVPERRTTESTFVNSYADQTQEPMNQVGPNGSFNFKEIFDLTSSMNLGDLNSTTSTKSINSNPFIVNSILKNRLICKFTNCNFIADTKICLRTHIKAVHYKESCPICQKKFGNLQHVKAHMDDYHSDKKATAAQSFGYKKSTFNCKNCKSTFKTLPGLLNHENNFCKNKPAPFTKPQKSTSSSKPNQDRDQDQNQETSSISKSVANNNKITYKIRCRIKNCNFYVKTKVTRNCVKLRYGHEQKHGLDEIYECFYCRDSFELLSCYEQHLEECAMKCHQPRCLGDCPIVDGVVVCHI